MHENGGYGSYPCLPHTTIKGGGHFVQENAPDQVAQVIIDLIRST